MARALPRGLAPLVTVLLVAELLLAARWRSPYEDEGWYLMAGRAVLEGRLPYRDFLFTQMPGQAWFSALVQATGVETLWAARLAWGLAGLLSLLVAVMLARLIGDEKAPQRTLCLALAAPVAAFSYVTCLSSAPSALMAVLPFTLLAWRGPTRTAAFLSGLLATGAVFFRMSLLPVPFAAGVLLWFSGGSPGLFAVGALCATALGLLPAATHPLGFIFGVFSFHSGTQRPTEWLYNLTGMVTDIAAYFGPLILALWLVARRVTPLPLRQDPGTWMPELSPREKLRTLLPVTLLAVIIASSLLHCISRTTGVRYQDILLPLALALVGSRPLFDHKAFAALLAVSFLAQGAMVLQEEYFKVAVRHAAVRVRDPLLELREASDRVQRLAGREARLATLSPTLAWASGLPTLNALEMGFFVVQLDLEDESARRIHAFTPHLLAEKLVAERPELVALSTFELRYFELEPVVIPALEAAGYTVVDRIPFYGQLGVELLIWRR